jgi:membrane-bound lytic murein transglycosylase D
MPTQKTLFFKQTKTGLTRIFLIMLTVLSTQITNATELFPQPAGLKADISFWKRIYSEVDSNSGLIHDARHLHIVYGKVNLNPDATRRVRIKQVKAAKARYTKIFEQLATGGNIVKDAEVQRVRALWPSGMNPEKWQEAADNLRFQLGQSDNFRAGLIRSGAWKESIREILRNRGLPLELAALPHVESSFNPDAWSKVGAAGMWQFTRSTGRRFMRIDHVVDERMDPMLASAAAARLLENNYATLGSWPLALTAYNHGVAGMRRAVAKLGTDDIETIVRQYDGRTFGFASRNFYVAFLAALEVDANATQLFGELQVNPRANHKLIPVPAYVSARDLQQALGVSRTLLREHNPALMPSIWRGNKLVPKAYELRLPPDAVKQDPAQLIAKIDRKHRHARQLPDVLHTVRRGESLSGIARKYGFRVSQLTELNKLRSRHRIRIGQVLRLPVSESVLARVDLGPEPLPEDGRYKVRRGDSLWEIAQRFGLDEKQLARANGIENARSLSVGQTLQVAALAPPATGAADTVAPAATEQRGAAEPATITEPTLTPAEAVAAEAPAEEAAPLAQVALADTADNEVVETGDESPLASPQPELAADPADYAVDANGTIEVQASETLGHYADWLQLRTQRLRDINRIGFREQMVFGRRLRLDFTRVDVQTFEARRVAYHRERQEAFFLRNQIRDTISHTIVKGDSIWLLSQRRYTVPIWLLRQYNPDLNLDRVRMGTVLRIPQLESRPVEEQADAS